MSLEPHWFSTIYGVLFMGGQGLSALRVRDRRSRRCSPSGRRSRASSRRRTFHDLGKLLLAFVMLWAYFALLAVPDHLVGQPAGGDPLVPAPHCSGGWQCGRRWCWSSSTSRCRSCCCSRATSSGSARALAVVALRADRRALRRPLLAGRARRSHARRASRVHWLDVGAPLARRRRLAVALRRASCGRGRCCRSTIPQLRAEALSGDARADAASRPTSSAPTSGTSTSDVDVARVRSSLAGLARSGRGRDRRGRADAAALQLLRGRARRGERAAPSPLAGALRRDGAAGAAAADRRRAATSRRCAPREDAVARRATAGSTETPASCASRSSARSSCSPSAGLPARAAAPEATP